MLAQQQIVDEVQQQSLWKWVKCNLVLRKTIQNLSYEFESLCEELEINSNKEINQNSSMIQISLQKAINFDSQMGFYWHKSWMIPQITVAIKPEKLRMLQQYQQFQEIYCAITSGYPQKIGNHFFINQVKMQGEAFRTINSIGSFKFSNMRFSQTSFNCNKKRFSLIVIVYGRCKNNQSFVIQSLISNPIHIDSRKEARKKNPKNVFLATKIPYNKFVKNLQGMNKRKMKMKNRKELLKYSKVQDDLQNFINYYTASNIRYKIKHPFYFGYHFPRTFKLYFNTQLLKNPFDLLTQIAKPMKSKQEKKYLYMIIRDPYEVQKQILQSQKNKPKKNKGSLKKSNISEQKKKQLKKLLFYNKKQSLDEDAQNNSNCQPEIKMASLKKKLIKLIQSWKFYFIEVDLKTQIECVPKKWKQISQQQQLQSYLAFSRYLPQNQLEAGQQRRQKKWYQFQIHQMIDLKEKKSRKSNLIQIDDQSIFSEELEVSSLKENFVNINESMIKNEIKQPGKWFNASTNPNSPSDEGSVIHMNQQFLDYEKKGNLSSNLSKTLGSKFQNKKEEKFNNIDKKQLIS